MRCRELAPIAGVLLRTFQAFWRSAKVRPLAESDGAAAWVSVTRKEATLLLSQHRDTVVDERCDRVQHESYPSGSKMAAAPPAHDPKAPFAITSLAGRAAGLMGAGRHSSQLTGSKPAPERQPVNRPHIAPAPREAGSHGSRLHDPSQAEP